MFFEGGSEVLVQAESADDAMKKLEVNGKRAVAAALEKLRPSFVTQQAGVIEAEGGNKMTSEEYIESLNKIIKVRDEEIRFLKRGVAGWLEEYRKMSNKYVLVEAENRQLKKEMGRLG